MTDQTFKETRYLGKRIKVNPEGTVVFVDSVRVKIGKIKNKGCQAREYVTVNGSSKLYLSHLMALAYQGPRPSPKHVAYYKDGNALNNHWENIEWGTFLDVAEVNHKLKRGTYNKVTKILSKRQRQNIADSLKIGITARYLARKYKVSHATITRIRKKFMEEKHGNIRYHTEVKLMVYRMLQRGLPAHVVALRTGIPYHTVYKWNKRTREELKNSACGHIKISDL